jgi:hypothetical protein
VPIETRTCPVLAFTPEIDSALRWFDATHELVTDATGRAWYRRTALPGAGGVGEQDAQLMDALDLLRRVHDDLVRKKAAE